MSCSPCRRIVSLCFLVFVFQEVQDNIIVSNKITVTTCATLESFLHCIATISISIFIISEIAITHLSIAIFLFLQNKSPRDQHERGGGAGAREHRPRLVHAAGQGGGALDTGDEAPTLRPAGAVGEYEPPAGQRAQSQSSSPLYFVLF